MTKEEIEKAKALCDAATDGPWKSGIQIRKDKIYQRKSTYWNILSLDSRGLPKFSICGDSSEDDTEFIAASRELVPKLISEVEKLQGQVDVWMSRSGKGPWL